MTTLGLDTGFCALWPHVATAAQLCPGQLNYQPFHRDLDELMAFCKERKPKFDAGLIFETSKWKTNLSRLGQPGWVPEISTTLFGLGSKAKDKKVKYVAEKTKGKVQASGNGEIWRKRFAMDGIWEQRHAETRGCLEKQQLQKKKSLPRQSSLV